jgi:hypothetical protein
MALLQQIEHTAESYSFIWQPCVCTKTLRVESSLIAVGEVRKRAAIIAAGSGISTGSAVLCCAPLQATPTRERRAHGG